MTAVQVLERCPQHGPGGVRCRHIFGHEGDHSWEGLENAATSREQQLADWWRQQAENEVGQTVSKAVEYSGTLGGLPQDLVDLGRQIAFVQRREREFTDAELAEIGVWSYMQGKLNRWSSALRNGRMVSDDTLFDIGVYVRIAQRIRATGEWP